MMQNEVDGEQFYKVKGGNNRHKAPSRNSQENTESDNDMPDIDDDDEEHDNRRIGGGNVGGHRPNERNNGSRNNNILGANVSN